MIAFIFGYFLLLKDLCRAIWHTCSVFWQGFIAVVGGGIVAIFGMWVLGGMMWLLFLAPMAEVHKEKRVAREHREQCEIVIHKADQSRYAPDIIARCERLLFPPHTESEQ